MNYVVGQDRGPVLEVIVSRLSFISAQTNRPVRIVGLSTALANARDLADWLSIKQVHISGPRSTSLTLFLSLDGTFQLPALSPARSHGNSHPRVRGQTLLSTNGDNE